MFPGVNRFTRKCIEEARAKGEITLEELTNCNMEIVTGFCHTEVYQLRAEERINVHKKLAPKRVVLSLTIILHR